MATTIQIKRSTGSSDPSSLAAGELAYTLGNNKLFIGDGSAPRVIGGKVFSDKLDHTDGILTASSAITTDSNSKVDTIKLRGADNSTPGNIVLDDNDGNFATTLKGAATLGGNIDITLPTTAGTLVGTGDTGSVSNTMLAGSIANNKLANDGITIGSDDTSLGDTITDLNGITSLDVDNITIDGNIISSTDSNGNIKLDPNGSGTVDVSSAKITNLGTPTSDADATTKAYVDGLINGLDIKESVKLATTANIAGTYNNGTGTITAGSNGALGNIDSIATTTGDRILVKDQTDAKQNGIYVITTVGDGSNPYVLTRAGDADASAEISGGAFFFVEQGHINVDNGFVTTHNGNPTLGTDNITFQQFSGAGQITAGQGIDKSGNSISVDLKANGGLVIESTEIAVDLGASSITGTLAVGDGGTGLTAIAKGSVLVANSANTLSALDGGGGAGLTKILLYNGDNDTLSFGSAIDGGTY